MADRSPLSPSFDELPVPVVALGPAGEVTGANASARVKLGAEVGDRSLPGTEKSGDARGSGVTDWASLFEGASQLGLGESGRVEAVRGASEGQVFDAAVRRIDASRLVAVLIDAGPRLALQSELARLQRAVTEMQRERERLGAIQQEISESSGTTNIVGSSAPILKMLDQVDRVAPSDATVLIHGETGSGKELVARAIHSGSPRAGKALISVNCASMPETLIESELFGHERGAFTGADRRRLGKFELADGGTLFLDEIAELSMQAQAKLLRVLQEGTFERVGGSETITVDVRIIAATHRDLALQVQRGRFREDLFYRLNVFRIDVPPLRDRREDVRPLAEHFHRLHAQRMARPELPISERSMRRMLAYRWPGNVRELENAVERATLLSTGTELDVDLPSSPAPAPGASRDASSRDTSEIPRDVLLDLSIDQLQRLQIMHALETKGYRVFGDDGAAEKLGINPQTLLSRMDKLGIPRPRALRAAMRRNAS